MLIETNESLSFEAYVKWRIITPRYTYNDPRTYHVIFETEKGRYVILYGKYAKSPLKRFDH